MTATLVKIAALALLLLLVPLVAQGMQPLQERDMRQVTAQSGIAITIDDLVLHQSGWDLWYQNEVEQDSPAAIGLAQTEPSVLYVRAITGMDSEESTFVSSGNYGLQGNYQAFFEEDRIFDPEEDFNFKPLTLQVVQASVFDSQMRDKHGEPTGESWSALDSMGHGEATAIVMGLPTIEVQQDPAAIQILVSSEENPVGQRREDPNTSSFGTLYSGIPFLGDTLAILDGRVEITPVEEIQ